jgi:hypothetical protein
LKFSGEKSEIRARISIRNKQMRNFAPVRLNDMELQDLIDWNTEFLEACSTDSIMTDECGPWRGDSLAK